MKKFNLTPVVNLNQQNTEIDKSLFSNEDLLTKEELSKIMGGGDDDPNTIIVGGPK